MMHAPSTSGPLIHSQRRSVRQRLPVSPAKQTWAQLFAAPRTLSLLLSQLRACALVTLVLGFLAQPGALLTWLPPGRMPWFVPLPCPSLVVEDDSPEGAPPGAMVLPVGAPCAPPATVLGTVALTHACFWPICYFKRPQLLTR